MKNWRHVCTNPRPSSRKNVYVPVSGGTTSVKVARKTPARVIVENKVASLFCGSQCSQLVHVYVSPVDWVVQLYSPETQQLVQTTDVLYCVQSLQDEEEEKPAMKCYPGRSTSCHVPRQIDNQLKPRSITAIPLVHCSVCFTYIAKHCIYGAGSKLGLV